MSTDVGAIAAMFMLFIVCLCLLIKSGGLEHDFYN